MQPYVYGPKFMWNLTASVGKGGANSNTADVSFIQWYYTLAQNFHLTEPANKEVYRNVRITGQCNGTDRDPLVAAIIQQQRSMGHPSVDGKVSVVTGTGKLGDKAFFLLRLEARFAIMYPNAWPRLDQIPNCPQMVKTAMLAAVPQLSEL